MCDSKQLFISFNRTNLDNVFRAMKSKKTQMCKQHKRQIMTTENDTKGCLVCLYETDFNFDYLQKIKLEDDTKFKWLKQYQESLKSKPEESKSEEEEDAKESEVEYQKQLIVIQSNLDKYLNPEGDYKVLKEKLYSFDLKPHEDKVFSEKEYKAAFQESALNKYREIELDILSLVKISDSEEDQSNFDYSHIEAKLKCDDFRSRINELFSKDSEIVPSFIKEKGYDSKQKAVQVVGSPELCNSLVNHLFFQASG